MMRGLPEKMFARPEADLKPDVADFRIEVFRGIGVLSKIEPHLRKQRCNERRLTGGKPLALAAAVELVARKVADAVLRFYQKLPASSGASSSVRSQEKPPSLSGWRPKCPYAAVLA